MSKENMSGFSLIEVLIAIMVFSVGILAIMTMQISSMNLNTRSDNATKAYELASEQMERLMMMDYNDMVKITTGLQRDGITLSPPKINSNKDVNSDGTNDSAVIEIEATWNNGRNSLKINCVRGRNSNV